MRPKFYETLGRYGDNIKDQMRVPLGDEQLGRLATAADVEIERRAQAGSYAI